MQVTPVGKWAVRSWNWTLEWLESGPAWRISGHLCSLDEGCLCVSGAASDLPGVLRFTRFSFFQQASLLLSLKWFKFCLSMPIFFLRSITPLYDYSEDYFFFQTKWRISTNTAMLYILWCKSSLGAYSLSFYCPLFSRFVNMVCHLSFSCHFGIVAFLLSII